jgi:hypothetical protein
MESVREEAAPPVGQLAQAETWPQLCGEGKEKQRKRMVRLRKGAGCRPNNAVR